jgi:hypothetical protein
MYEPLDWRTDSLATWDCHDTTGKLLANAMQTIAALAWLCVVEGEIAVADR